MFPLLGPDAATELLDGEPWAFIGCVSFEDRWESYINHFSTRGIQPTVSHVLFPIDSDSRWKDVCSQRQEEHWIASVANHKWRSVRTDIELLRATPWYHAIRFYKRAAADAAKVGVSTFLIDFTTMPRVCYLPIIHAALNDSTIKTLVVVYSQPKEYKTGALTSEPVDAIVIPPFGELPVRTRKRPKVAWVPILGFEPCFITKISERLAEYAWQGRVFPLIGYPAYEPAFFERTLNDSARVVVESVKDYGSRDHFIYSNAADPFETRETILRLVSQSPDDLHWMGSPMGSKPMALGMLLAACEVPMTIIIARPRSYHPQYSSGCGPQHVYPLKLHGLRAYG
jgi:hypothetical protein